MSGSAAGYDGAVTTSTVRPGIAERLSQMIRIPTVSAELDERGSAPFEEFVALIAELYPLTHESCVWNGTPNSACCSTGKGAGALRRTRGPSC